MVFDRSVGAGLEGAEVIEAEVCAVEFGDFVAESFERAADLAIAAFDKRNLPVVSSG